MATYKTKIIDKISGFFIDGQQNIIQSFITLDTNAIAHKENWKKKKIFLWQNYFSFRITS